MTIMKLLTIFLLAVTGITALTCQLYDHDKCVSVGCDVHCQGLGKKGGYCSLSGGYCTCNCINSLSDHQDVCEFNIRDSCTCRYQHYCYSCGAVIQNSLICTSTGCWKNCTGDVQTCVNLKAGCNPIVVN